MANMVVHNNYHMKYLRNILCKHEPTPQNIMCR